MGRLADIAFLCDYQSLPSFSNTFYHITKIRLSKDLMALHTLV
jgi:hypothetical protein